MLIDRQPLRFNNKLIDGTNNTLTNIGNASLSDMAQATIKGRASGAGTGVPTDLTATQVAAILMGRRILTANETFYFRSGGDGTGFGAVDDSTAFASWPAAYAYIIANIYDNGYTITIKQGTSGVSFPTTYSTNDATTVSQPLPGGGLLIIEGRADPADVVLDYNGAGVAVSFSNQFSNKVTFRGFTIDSAGTICLRHTAVGRLEIDDLIVMNATGTLVSVQDFGAQMILPVASTLQLTANASGTSIGLQVDAGSYLEYGQVETEGDFGTVLDARFGSTTFSEFQWDESDTTTGTQADVREGCSILCGTDGVVDHFTGDSVPTYRGSGIISDGIIFAGNITKGTFTFAGIATHAVTLPFEMPDTAYAVHYDAPEDRRVWTTSKTVTGFTANVDTNSSAAYRYTAVRDE